MINTMKSVGYGMRRDKGVLFSLGFMAIIPYLTMLFLFAVEGMELKNLTPSYYFASQNMAMITLLFYYPIVIIVCKAMGGDLSDKTINYEILSGHKRGTVFSARAMVGALWGAVLPILFIALPLFVFWLLNGWGMETDPKDILLRVLLSVFPLMRLCALNMMFASLLGSSGKGIVVGFLAELFMSIIQSVSEEVFHVTLYYGLTLNNIMVLLTSPNSRELIVDGKPVTVFETAVSGQMVLKTIGFSLAVSAVYLMIAYTIFRKKDRS